LYKLISVGIDQSYTRSGISISADGVLKKVTSIPFKGCTTKTDKRREIAQVLHKVLTSSRQTSTRTVIIVERIRTFSGKDAFLSMNYIKATAALIAVIVDVAAGYDVPVFSVDTRAWKSKIVGTSKGSKESNKLKTIKHVKRLGFDVSSKNKKGNIVYDDDAADSACISLYAFLPKSTRMLKREH